MCLCLKGVWRNNCLFDLIIFLVRIMIILVYFIYNLFFYSSVVREFLSALKIDIYIFTVYDNCTTNSPHKIEHFRMTCVFFLFCVFVQKTKRAVRRPSSALGRTCASLSVGSVTGTKTVLMGPTRASKLAVVRLDWAHRTLLPVTLHSLAFQT